MTILQVRGTSGSGKTTAMRRIIEGIAPLPTWTPAIVVGRRRPLYYRRGNVIVIGHYEPDCASGGGDTIGSAKAIHALIDTLPTESDILAEGLLLSEDTLHTLQLREAGWDVRCLFLTTPLDECLRRVEGRRQERGNAKPLNPANTENRVGVIERARAKLVAARIECRRCTSEQAPSLALKWLKIKETSDAQ